MFSPVAFTGHIHWQVHFTGRLSEAIESAVSHTLGSSLRELYLVVVVALSNLNALLKGYRPQAPSRRLQVARHGAQLHWQLIDNVSRLKTQPDWLKSIVVVSVSIALRLKFKVERAPIGLDSGETRRRCATVTDLAGLEAVHRHCGQGGKLRVAQGTSGYRCLFFGGVDSGC